MGEPAPEGKRLRSEAEEAAAAPFDEKAETVPSHTVIVSTVGDVRPDEVVADSVATFFLNLRRSVTTYVVVPLFAPEPVFLANFRVADEGGLKSRYVKKMIPSTAHL
jgi:hypothetical protein